MKNMYQNSYQNTYPQTTESEKALLFVPSDEKAVRILNRRKCFCLSGLISSVCLILGSITIYGRHQRIIGESTVFYSHGIIDRHPKLDERLIFEENFDYLNEDIWTIEEDMGGGGNMEFQFYRNSPDNIGVSDGKLYIKPGLFWEMGDLETAAGVPYPALDVMLGECEPFPHCAMYELDKETCTNPMWGGCNKTGNVPDGTIINPVTSGRLNSFGKFSFKYGRVEVRARLPAGDWLWPAIWMLPNSDETYGTWPASGEVDIVESRGNGWNYTMYGDLAGRNYVGQTLHFGPPSINAGDGWPHAHNEHKADEGTDFTEDFYTYGFYWDVDAMYLYIIHPDGSEHLVLDFTHGFEKGFWHAPIGFEGTDYPGWYVDNPYEGHPVNAPYDQEFYFIMNLAIGGEIYWDSPWDKVCWAPPYCNTYKWFYEHRDTWYPSWTEAGDHNSMEIDWIRVWQ